MKMSFRWYGQDDPVTLKQIAQIPGLEGGIVTAIYDLAPGKVWPLDKILDLKKTINDHHLVFEVVESLPVHEDIKLGLPTRDHYIANYKESLINLGKAGIKVVTYNFMPIWDWFRTTASFKHVDHSTALAYNHQDYVKMAAEFKNLDFSTKKAQAQFEKWKLPGWDLAFVVEELGKIVEQYKKIDAEKLWEHLEYFIKAIIPTAKAAGIKMAIHPDDPPWDIFNVPRIITNQENLTRFLNIDPSINHGLALCAGSLGSLRTNDPVQMVKTFSKRIHFAHLRNLKHLVDQDDYSFVETSHHYQAGSIDMLALIKAYVDTDFQGYVRPDHGRMIWGETGRAGYGLFDRALGATYLNGIIHGILKEKNLIKDFKKGAKNEA